jgi:preprotein translocase subunit SecA
VEFDAADFSRCDFVEADKAARDKALRQVETQVNEALEENLGAEDPKEWNWQALANQVNSRWGLKTNDRQLKQIGKDNLAEYLIEQANQSIRDLNLDDGKQYLEPNWGLQSLCDWARLKFQIRLDAEALTGKDEDEVKKVLHQGVMALYRQKEIEFPVRAGMARFMADSPGAMGPGGQRYNREGLYHWAMMRFPGAKLFEEEFRTQSRHRLQEMLIEVSKASYPARDEEEIDARLDEALRGTSVSEEEDARELAEWAKNEIGLEVPVAELTGVTRQQARDVLWNAFDDRYRPEMHQMERSLVLHQLDTSWKNHLYQMDHLRSGIGLVGYAQEDPKTVYKQEGMKEFRVMWDGIEDKVSEMVFRMEETEAFQESVWTIGATIHESAPRGFQAEGQTNAPSEKKAEPIRNRGEKVGRNDPCPCGSGKKYKNCHMRQAV